MKKCIVNLLAGLLAVAVVWAEEDADLALKLSNPVANLISVPIQANYDENIGPSEDGSVWRINVQPVIPFELNDEWNVITRTIVPVSLTVGLRYWADAPDNGPEDWGFRLVATVLLPK